MEISIALSILISVLLGFCQALMGSMSASRSNRETTIAVDAARQMIESLKAIDMQDVFAANNSVNGDDPAGVPALLAAFDVDGLNARAGDADGMCGEIIFPEVAAAGASQLLENVNNRTLDMPRDLNGDGLIDAVDHSADYKILPVIVRVDWRGPGGRDARVQFKTILSGF